LCADPRDVLARLTSRTKAVLVVHYGGFAMDIGALRAVLPGRVALVEDAAHAFGARFSDGRPVGSSGHPTCFSFYANKNLSTAEGGAIAVADGALADRLRSLRQHALPLDAWKRYTHPRSLLRSNQLDELGYKMNYTDLQAAIGRVQLARQSEFEAIRLDIAYRYVEGLKEIALPLRLQRDCAHPYHARHLFVVLLPVAEMKLSRDDVVLALRAKNIGAAIHYAPLHPMPLYGGSGKPPSLPVTEQVGESIVTLPISASMSLDDAEYVLTHLRAILE